MSEAIFLGLIQGITEFLPVSSSGHLALAELLFDVREGGLTLNVMLHAGTLIATIVMLRVRVATAVRDGARALLKPRLFSETPGGSDARTVILASVPTALLGFGLRDTVEQWTRSPWVVGIGFTLTGILLLSTRFVKPGRQDQPSNWGALALGVAQGLAVTPGISRSGITITLALWLGIRPQRAFELSMLMSVPAVLGAVMLELPLLGGGEQLLVASVGAVVALFSGLLAVYVLGRLVTHGFFSSFALWVLPLAFATLALAWAWPEVRL